VKKDAQADKQFLPVRPSVEGKSFASFAHSGNKWVAASPWSLVRSARRRRPNPTHRPTRLRPHFGEQLEGRRPVSTGNTEHVVGPRGGQRRKKRGKGKTTKHVPCPSSLKMSSRLSSSLSFFPRRLFFPPFPTHKNARYHRCHVYTDKQVAKRR
jgi:hypothetical protein